MRKIFSNHAFTLVEMLIALLIVSIILSASLPVITSRQKARIQHHHGYNYFPIGGIIVWGSDKPLPDNTWLECNGQAIPSGLEYKEIRQIYGSNLPDYRGVFLRGYGSITYSQNNGSRVGITATTHSSGALGYIQGDSIRNATGQSGATIGGGHSGIIYTKGVPEVYWIASAHTLGTYSTYIDFSRVLPTANEIRPINKAVRYIIKVRH